MQCLSTLVSIRLCFKVVRELGFVVLQIIEVVMKV